uniref:Homeobox domain-containing protein n=1 Tax=Mola mola TaxID=94237 RepID=A0A3Q3VJL3_MOLML
MMNPVAFVIPATVGPVPGTFSMPLDLRGKPRKGMLRWAGFSDLKQKALERIFHKKKYISKLDRKNLASKLGLKDSQVKIWFQNQRMKLRNSKERICFQQAAVASRPSQLKPIHTQALLL